MPKKVMIFCLTLALVSFKLYAQTMSIDDAIRLTSSEMGQQLNRGNQIAVLSFASQWQDLSAYIVEEMNNAIVRDGLLTVVDRLRLDLARQELDFNMSGDVSDASAQRIGQFLGAQSVLTGSFTAIGDVFRFRIQVVSVETGVMLYSNSLNVTNDSILSALMNGSSSTPDRVVYFIPQRNYAFSNFGRNLGYGLLNPLFGLGSYLQGDIISGGIITAAYVISGTLIIVEFATIADYWDDNAGLLGTIGLGFAAPALLWGFIGPFVFHSRGGVRYAQVLDGLRIGIVPTAYNGTDVSIRYSKSF